VLLVLTIVLVAVAVVTLVVGYASSSVPWIYVSIGCSALAAVMLYIFSRLSKRPAVLAGSVVGVPVPPPSPLFAPEPLGALEEDGPTPLPGEPVPGQPPLAEMLPDDSPRGDDGAAEDEDGPPEHPDERPGRLSGPA
jgi:hypothetical protein